MLVRGTQAHNPAFGAFKFTSFMRISKFFHLNLHTGHQNESYMAVLVKMTGRFCFALLWFMFYGFFSERDLCFIRKGFALQVDPTSFPIFSRGASWAPGQQSPDEWPGGLDPAKGEGDRPR